MPQLSDEVSGVAPLRGARNRTMFMIVYPEYVKEDVLELMDRLQVPGFTETEKVVGRGPRGLHFDNQIWPGSDGMIYTAVSADTARVLEAALAEFSRGLEQRSRGLYGLHVFTWACEQAF